MLKKAAWLENFQPHMHLRGKAMAVDAILPDGTTQTISYVGNFNFNWMTNYIYARRCGSGASEGHGHPRDCVVGQHQGQPEQS